MNEVKEKEYLQLKKRNIRVNNKIISIAIEKWLWEKLELLEKRGKISSQISFLKKNIIKADELNLNRASFIRKKIIELIEENEGEE